VPAVLVDLKQREPEPQLAPQSDEQDLVQDNANAPVLATHDELNGKIIYRHGMGIWSS